MEEKELIFKIMKDYCCTEQQAQEINIVLHIITKQSNLSLKEAVKLVKEN